ncbi:hypothetical protein [Blastococcus xanthinilyticus]|uniref:hypothetical protein n=1 Tax=Blastococcus xanthinilyticus TaxID=1564164 RepID=UPI001412B19E|nr:hypothetical protein [Blastococcus xanthinilyticus]
MVSPTNHAQSGCPPCRGSTEEIAGTATATAGTAATVTADASRLLQELAGQLEEQVALFRTRA